MFAEQGRSGLAQGLLVESGLRSRHPKVLVLGWLGPDPRKGEGLLHMMGVTCGFCPSNLEEGACAQDHFEQL